VMAVSDTCYYVIVSATGTDWETGTGTYSAASVLTRTTVLSSSNSGNAVSFTSGTKDVFIGPVAECVTDIAHGGTGATTAAGARTNLGVSTGTVTSASVVSANGFGGTVATATTTPAITLTTSITGLLKGNSTAISAAVAGTDYLTPSGSAAALTSFPTLNQNTTGNAATVTTNANLTGHITSVGNAAVLGSFTSAQLASALSDETGTGAAVFSNSPTLVTPLSNALSAVPVASGPGNSLTLSAGSAASSGAGGNLILQAGIQHTTGGDGKVIVKQATGQTGNLQEWQNSAGVARLTVGPNGAIFLTPGSDSNNVNNVIFAKDNNYLYVQGGTNGTIIGGNTARNNQIAIDSAFWIYINGAHRLVVTATGNTGIGINSLTVNNLLSVTSPTTADSLADVLFATTATTKKGLVIQAKASQTANLQEWQNSAGTALASVSAGGVVKTVVLTVATLPAAATAGAGSIAFVSDANATTFASIVAGGGANGVPVYSDGTNWRIG